MKKLLLSFLLLFASVIYTNAQLSISYNGTDITGQDVFFDSLAINTNINHIFEVHNASGTDISCHFIRKDIDPPSAFTHLFCFGLHCFSGTTFSCNEPIVAGAKADFHPTIYLPDNVDGYTFRYTFYDNANINDSVWITVNHSDVSGINDLSNNLNLSVYPNPANNQATFSYDLMGNAGSLVIRNIIGKEVKSIELNSASKKMNVNTSDLPSGMYICSAVSGKRTINSMKLIVSH